MRAAHDLVAAVSTAPGSAGVAVIRLSGDGADEIARKLAGEPLPVPRFLELRAFRDAGGRVIDRGLIARFVAPASFTGQGMLELHCHGGQAVTQSLLSRCLELGARAADPGEFSLRAYLNGKLDLAQAEAVCDLIAASTEAGARAAARTMDGELSAEIGRIGGKLTEARAHAEARLDFPEEEIPPEDAREFAGRVLEIEEALSRLARAGRQGALLGQGLRIAVVGEPNVGKSSIVNRLAREDVAIVAASPGTTRDPVRQAVSLRGVRVEFVDTAGIRETQDPVEAEGISRTLKAAGHADLVVLVREDVPGPDPGLPGGREPDLVALNKIDLSGSAPGSEGGRIRLSAKSGEGMGLLEDALLQKAGHEPLGDVFMARPRHLRALELAMEGCARARDPGLAPEVAAEELRIAHDALGQITGRVAPDDLLGEIFSRFCIGK